MFFGMAARAPRRDRADLVLDGPLLGNVEAGIVASLFGLRASIVSGGLPCVAGVGVAVVLLPAFWRYDSRIHPLSAATA